LKTPLKKVDTGKLHAIIKELAGYLKYRPIYIAHAIQYLSQQIKISCQNTPSGGF
jgi:hypothetical protein